jgi:hypothetical protein
MPGHREVLMSDQIEQTQISLIQAIIHATIDKRLDWIRTNPEEVKWKEGTIEQRYTMLSDDGIFATFSRMRDGSMELLVQVQETGCYREYELSFSDGPKIVEQLSELYKVLPSTFKMIEDFQMVIDKLQNI